ncbi:MAG: transcriptional regulator [Actinomycetota bacterium]|nr:transcriptional regulator [Actinomycetota bacterium]
MAQLTVRLDDTLAREVKTHAAELGRSVNSWVVDLLNAAVNPDLEESEAQRTRARLERAGLLAKPRSRPRAAAPPDRRRVERARKAAGTGTPLSRLVSDGRG